MKHNILNVRYEANTQLLQVLGGSTKGSYFIFLFGAKSHKASGFQPFSVCLFGYLFHRKIVLHYIKEGQNV